jgi:hypothetical protein
LLSRLSNSSFAKSPDCGSPYIPRLAWMYSIPLLSAISLSFYSMMISSGMLLMLMHMNSGRFSGVIR